MAVSMAVFTMNDSITKAVSSQMNFGQVMLVRGMFAHFGEEPSEERTEEFYACYLGHLGGQGDAKGKIDAAHSPRKVGRPLRAGSVRHAVQKRQRQRRTSAAEERASIEMPGFLHGVVL